MAVRRDNSPFFNGEVLEAADLNDTFGQVDNSEEVFTLMAINRSGMFNYDNLLVNTGEATVETSNLSDTPNINLTSIDATITSIQSYSILNGTDKVRLFCLKTGDLGILIDLDMTDLSYTILHDNFSVLCNTNNVDYPETFTAKYCHVVGDNYLLVGQATRTDNSAVTLFVNKYDVETNTYDSQTTQSYTGNPADIIFTTQYEIKNTDSTRIRIAYEVKLNEGSNSIDQMRVQEIRDLEIIGISWHIFTVYQRGSIEDIVFMGFLKDGRMALSYGWTRHDEPPIRGANYMLSDGTLCLNIEDSPGDVGRRGNYWCGNFGVGYAKYDDDNLYRFVYIKKDGTTYTTPTSSPYTGEWSFTITDKKIIGITSNYLQVLMDGGEEQEISTLTESLVDSIGAREKLTSSMTCDSEIPFYISGTTIYNVQELGVEFEVELDTPISVKQLAYIEPFNNSMRSLYDLDSYELKVSVCLDGEYQSIDPNAWEILDESKNFTKFKLEIVGKGGGTKTFDNHIFPYRT